MSALLRAHSDEVYFRDTAHGFVSWALASVIGVILLATPATSFIGSGRDTVIKEREPADRTTVIKKEHDDGTRSKTIIKERE
jgi:hypothetical protein